MKIGRNDPCPCGSGKKYKKCCLRQNILNEISQDLAITTELSSNFEHIKSTSRTINRVLQTYKFEDVVKAVFCLNLWRKNRSALQQCLSLNMALDIGGDFGQTPIQSYSELEIFYKEIFSSLPLTGFEDYIVDDYGEVFINVDGESYPVLLGTGHQQVYATIRYLQTLAAITNHNLELKTILEYVRTILMADDCQGLEFSFDRVKLPAGGGTAFEIPSAESDESEMAKDIPGVIVYNHPAYAYYRDKYTGGNNPPDCGSFDKDLLSGREFNIKEVVVR